MFMSLPGLYFTYLNALTNGKNLEFFDITDDTETASNHGADANGELPPSQPQISTIGASVFIGGSTVFNGNNFNTVPEEDLICFAGGICPHPDSATSTQLTLNKVPAGAISGPVDISIGILDGDPVTTDVGLEDSSFSALTIRTIGFSSSTGDYWTADLDGANNRVYRHYYDATQEKWLRETRNGTFVNTHYCSTKTDRSGKLYCAEATLGTAAAATRQIVTDPPADMTNCLGLTCPGGHNCQVIGAAPDPNPNAVAGRDVVYFAFNDTGVGSGKFIRKVNTSCTTVLDSDYGNRGGVWTWPSIVGMSVDAETGDLYVSERTKITKITTSEAVSTFKTGFSNVFGLDVWRDPGQTFGAILVSDNGASLVKAIALDNVSVTPLLIAAGSTVRAVAWSRTTFSLDTWVPSEVIRRILVHNDGSTIKLRDPYLVADPYAKAPANIWISSPDTNDKGTYQGIVRPSNATSDDYSTVRVGAWWSDGVTRRVCAVLGDPPATALYEPFTVASGCNLPYKDPATGTISSMCDNQDPFVAGGVGSSTLTDDFVDCRDCGAANIDPCFFDFRITKRYAGDNYRVFFTLENDSWPISSALVTAWKRPYIELDKMCANGGLLYQPCIACSDVNIVDWGQTISVGESITIFDLDTPFDQGETRTVLAPPIHNPDGTLTVPLNTAVSGTYQPTDYDDAIPPHKPQFVTGQSAGICDTTSPTSGFYTPYASDLNNNGPFDDAFTQFRVSKDDMGVLPYVTPDFFDKTNNLKAMLRFHHMWFKNKSAAACGDSARPCYIPPADCIDCCNDRKNFFHLVGTSKDNDPDAGAITCDESDAAFLFIPELAGLCGNTQPCTSNYIRTATDHEVVHFFNVNPQCLKEHDFEDPDTDNDAWCGGNVSSACINPAMSPLRTACLMSGAVNSPDFFAQSTDEYNYMDCEDLDGLAAACPPVTTCGGIGVRNQVDPH
jgi:hypothetical protein